MDQNLFFKRFFVDFTAASARPFDWLKYGELVTCWKFHSLANCVYASEMNWGLLSVKHIVGDPGRAKTRFVASITEELCKFGRRSNPKKSL